MTRRFSRRDFVKSSSAALGAFALPGPRVRVVQEFDLVIRNGTILDGTGGPPWQGDLGIVGDTITAVGTIDPARGSRVLDVGGLHVSPGFIDMHSHSDSSIFAYPTADSRAYQGITTEVTGQCGFSAAPLEGVDADKRKSDMAEEAGAPVEWSDIPSYFATLEGIGISVNQAMLLGHGTMRQNMAGLDNRTLTQDEMRAFMHSIEQGMDEGAFGLSTGLEYTPGTFTPTEEVVTLTRVVARRGGFYSSHIRNEESGLLEAVNEAIHIGRETGARVEIAHFKAAGPPNWPKQRASLNLVESARRDGVQVLADAYPYTAYSTSMTIFFPAWALEGGWSHLEQRLNDPSDRARIAVEVGTSVAGDPGGFDRIVVVSTRTEQNRSMVGKNVEEIAAEWQVEPVDAALRLVLEEEGMVAMIGHGMSVENVEMVLSHPLVMIGSDGTSVAPTGKAAETKPHPRYYGTCARVLAHYCRERGIFDLPTAVKKMTSMPADQAGIRDRGRIARGKRADIVVFSSGDVKDEATFEDPHRFASGIEHVLVNGEHVIENGQHTGARPGRVLRKA
jgi:N-acyl-D-amino-acid deacylase